MKSVITLLCGISVFDRNGNGAIDKSELKEAMVRLGENLTDQQIDEMFAEADENNDGEISFEGLFTFHLIL